MKKFLEEKITAFKHIKKIRGEASTRAFFRVYFDNYSLVAMVYPRENPQEIEKIVRFSKLYTEHRMFVPDIKEVIDNRIILQEDLGDTLIQKSLSKPGIKEKKIILKKTADILKELSDISCEQTSALLGHERMKWEMDFFLQHFAGNSLPGSFDTESLRENLYKIVDKIGDINCFAHRDFHSRNILHHKGELYLVDFQDSLVASPYYDLVSFAYDSYLDLKSLREFLIEEYEKRHGPVDIEQLQLAALQRNIKALGTFGYQVHEKKNLAYKKYINRTIRHIMNNPAVLGAIKDFFIKLAA